MRAHLLWLVAIAILPMGTSAGDDKKQAAAGKTPREQYDAVLQDYQLKFQEFQQAVTKAKTPQERSEAAKLMPQPQEFATRLLDLAGKNPGDPVAVDALVWVVRQTRQGSAAKQALTELTARHVRSNKLTMACLSLAYTQSAEAEKFLRAVAVENPDLNMKGFATYGLAQFLKQKAELLDILEGQPELLPRVAEFYGADYAEGLKNVDRPRIRAEVEQLYEKVASDFKAVRDPQFMREPLGKLVEKDLFEIRFLSIGKMAPEIEGDDVDGVKFKLSDYRGKVVVLDFWGDW